MPTRDAKLFTKFLGRVSRTNLRPSATLAKQNVNKNVKAILTTVANKQDVKLVRIEF